MIKTVGSSVLGLVVALGVLASASPAEAYWWHGRWIGPVAVVPAPAARVYVAPPPRYWVPPHYNRFGYFVPGHWR